ncbi:MAG TPA: hypothetical protein ACN46O_07380 [Prochlorococcus sp.]|jgi:hypothetical protein|nr:hypothetical protein [Prochlorococcaceae cyanobacterium ETNP18_MAG_17]MDP6321730.1 hypothetical protein [Prochlorococcaceae cyanobacterium ETNP14_MAG_5]MDP6851444.1 hypothetical protein [Prochlorococcaceae cyanobacterium ETNP1_MAG_8]
MGRVVLLKRPFLLLAVLVTACSGFNPVHAQRMVKKLKTICPLGYVDTFNGKCSTLGLITYTVKPTNGEACPSGWMNVGGGYCRKK